MGLTLHPPLARFKKLVEEVLVDLSWVRTTRNGGGGCGGSSRLFHEGG